MKTGHFIKAFIKEFKRGGRIHLGTAGSGFSICAAWFCSHTSGRISIEHVTIFLHKYLSKGAVDMKLSPDVGNNPYNPLMQRNQTIDVHK